MSAFKIAVSEYMNKVANPAQPVKSSKGGMEVGSPRTPYLNQGGGQAAQQTAGCVDKKPSPEAGYINIGDKQPGAQVPGFINRGAAPDTGERGAAEQGTQALTKSAAFDAGVNAIIEAYNEID